MRVTVLLMFVPLAVSSAQRPPAPPTAAALLADGDTVAALRRLSQGAFLREQPVGPDVMRLAVRALGDTNWTTARSANPAFILYDALQMLTRFPPVLEPDSTKWGCTPAACRLLAAEWPTARTPQLRTLALTAHTVLDPITWAPVVEEAMTEDTTGLGTIDLILRGVGSVWPAATKRPLPAVGATWQEWADWMNGRSPALPRRGSSLDPERLRFGESHLRGARIAAIVQGRDLAAELTSSLAAASSDTARTVFRFLLTQLGAPQDAPELLADRMLNGSAVEQSAARREITTLLERAPLADSATTLELQRGILQMMFDGSAPWLKPDTVGKRQGSGPFTPRDGDKVFLVAPGLAERLRAEYRARGVTVVDSGAQVPRDIATSTYWVGAIRRSGPFASIEWRYGYSTPGARGAPSPGAFGTGGTDQLFWTGTEWQFLGGRRFIT